VELKSEFVGLGFDVLEDEIIVISCHPDDAEEIGGVEVMLFAEWSISTASVHQFIGHFAAQFGTGFGDESGQPGYSIQLICFGREVVHGNQFICPSAPLLAEEIVATGRGYEQDRLKGWFATTQNVVLHQVENLPGGRPNGTQEFNLFIGEHFFQVLMSTHVDLVPGIVNFTECVRPVVVIHSGQIFQSPPVGKPFLVGFAPQAICLKSSPLNRPQ
jgi:hypothetical protein